MGSDCPALPYEVSRVVKGRGGGREVKGLGFNRIEF